jgi:hypothetical protein
VIDVVFTFMGALSSLGSFVLKIAGFLVGTFEKAVNGIIDVVNFAIRQANKLNPFSDIPEIGKVSISSSFGAAPSAPSAPGAAVPDRLDRMESGASSMPSFTIPPVGGGTSTGGGGGGGGGGGAATSPFDPSAYDAKNRYYTMPVELSSAYAAKSRFYEIPSALDAAYAPKQAIYNVTVNTVTADANLPNLVVEALQTYNLVSGPLDVQIAV